MTNKLNVLLGLVMALHLSAHAEKGFYEPGEYFSDEVVGAIFQYSSGLYISQKIESEEKYRELLEGWKNHALVPEQLKKCWKGQPVSCILNLGTGVFGSAVQVEEASGHHIWTNLHLVRSYLESRVAEASQSAPYAVVRKQMMTWNLPMVLTNAKGEVVFDSLNGSDQANLVAIDSTTLDPKGAFRTNSSDAVKIKLSRHIGPALKKGRVLTTGDEAFVIGYPKKTEDRQINYRRPDSRGEGKQHLTYGKVWDAVNFVAENGLDPLIGILALDQSYVYTLSSDCEVGQSGGAILNKKGEFVGLFQSILEPKSIGKRLACLGLNLNSLRFIEIMAE